MISIPDVVVFYEISPLPMDPGAVILSIADAAWRYDRRKTLVVDADPGGRVTAEAHRRVGRRYLPPTGDELTLDDHLEAAAQLDLPPPLSPWRLSRNARRLVPSGTDVTGAHARALGAVVATGGALNLQDRLADVLYPTDEGVDLTLVLAPPPGGGLGALLGAQADLVVLLCSDLEMLGPARRAVDRICSAATSGGPHEALPLLLGAGRRPARALEADDRMLAPIVLARLDDERQLRQVLRALPVSTTETVLESDE